MYSLIKKIALLAWLSSSIYAGDPCPIHFKFYDAGVPQWLDREDILEALKADSTKTDPLLTKFREYTAKQDCTKTEEKEPSFDLIQEIKAKTFIHVKSFNCRGAHKKLKKIKDLSSGDIVLVRGSRRVLISHVGWNTVCVQSSAYNGRHLSTYKLQTLFDKLFSEYILKKYSNP